MDSGLGSLLNSWTGPLRTNTDIGVPKKTCDLQGLIVRASDSKQYKVIKPIGQPGSFGTGWLVERSIDPRLLSHQENPTILFAEVRVFEYVESKLGAFPHIYLF